MRLTIEKNNLEAIERYLHLEENKQFDKLGEIYKENIIWSAPARGIALVGTPQIIAHYRLLFSAQKERETEELDRFATEERVFDDHIIRFTVAKEGIWPGLKIGQRVEMRLARAFAMDNEKITRETHFEIWKIIK